MGAAMDVVLFRNRMGGRNLLWAGLGFLVAAVVLVYQGIPLLEVALYVGLLMLAAFAFIWGLIAWMGRSNAAEVRLRDGRLSIEMVHILGRGQVVMVPLSAVSRIALRRQKNGAGAGRDGFWIDIFAQHKCYRLPLYGASVFDRALLKQIAPEAAADLERIATPGARGKR